MYPLYLLPGVLLLLAQTQTPGRRRTSGPPSSSPLSPIHAEPVASSASSSSSTTSTSTTTTTTTIAATPSSSSSSASAAPAVSSSQIGSAASGSTFKPAGKGPDPSLPEDACRTSDVTSASANETIGRVEQDDIFPLPSADDHLNSAPTKLHTSQSAPSISRLTRRRPSSLLTATETALSDVNQALASPSSHLPPVACSAMSLTSSILMFVLFLTLLLIASSMFSATFPPLRDSSSAVSPSSSSSLLSSSTSSSSPSCASFWGVRLCWDWVYRSYVFLLSLSDATPNIG